jgi:Domain of unknown function (DUF6438)
LRFRPVRIVRWRRLAAVLVFTTACGSLAARQPGSIALAQTPAVPDDVVIRLERTACFGTCPVYAVSIDARGNVTYEGKKFVRVPGRRTDRVPVSTVAALLGTADRIGFFDLRDFYRTVRNADGSETMVTDLPTTFVTITRAGRTKRVEDYYGAPEGLRELEQQIDESARTKRWISPDERTNRTSGPTIENDSKDR